MACRMANLQSESKFIEDLAGKEGVPKTRYQHQNWFTCGSASGRGLFSKLGSLW